MNASNSEFAVTYFKGLNTTDGEPFAITWDIFVGLLREKPREYDVPEEQGKANKPADLGLIIPAIFRGGRKAENHIKSHALVFDFDGTWQIEDAQKALEGCAAVLHTTFNDKDGSRFRAYALLSRPVTADEYQRCWDAMHQNILAGQETDRAARSVAQMMYGPAIIKGRHYKFYEIKGIPAPVERLLNMATTPTTPTTSAPTTGATPTTDIDFDGELDSKYHAAAEQVAAGLRKECPARGKRAKVCGDLAGALARGDCLKDLPPPEQIPAFVVEAAQLAEFGTLEKKRTFAKTTVKKKSAGEAVTGWKILKSEHPAVYAAMQEAFPSRAVALTSRANDTWVDAERMKVSGSYRNRRDPDHKYTFDVSHPANGEQRSLRPTDLNNVFAGEGANSFWRGVFQYDGFKHRVVAINPPARLDAEYGGVSNDDLVILQHWLGYKGYRVPLEPISNAIHGAAKLAIFHPVKDYLDALPKPTIDEANAYFTGIASRLWGAGPDVDARESEALKRQLVAAVRRVRKPGTKVDEMLILHGPQGFGKSRFLAKVFGEYFTDNIGGDWANKDAAQALRGVWGVEVGELTGWSRTDQNVRKSFLSRSIDHYREAYGRDAIDYPRQCVFFGTTNDDDFLNDPTGNRRYNVVHIETPIKVDDFDRDALWAAANVLETSDYIHFFSLAESNIDQSAYEKSDPWESKIVNDLLKGKETVLATSVLSELGKAIPDQNPSDLKRVQGILRRICGPATQLKIKGTNVRVYDVPETFRQNIRVSTPACVAGTSAEESATTTESATAMTATS